MSTWVLLRGLTREQRHWLDFPQLLASALPGNRVITLELPGSGMLNAIASPPTIEGMASHCRAELARLGVPPPYRLLALSMGAMVATAWAAEHPEEVQGCVLINTSFASFSPFYQRLRPGAWWALCRLVLTRSPLRREQLIFGLTSRLVAPSAPVVEAWVAIRRTRAVRPGNALRQMFAAARFQAPIRPPVPTLVLASAGDRLVDPPCSEAIARQWNCASAFHPTAGHDLSLDDGAWVAHQVQNWLTGFGPPEDHM